LIVDINIGVLVLKLRLNLSNRTVNKTLRLRRVRGLPDHNLLVSLRGLDVIWGADIHLLLGLLLSVLGFLGLLQWLLVLLRRLLVKLLRLGWLLVLL